MLYIIFYLKNIHIQGEYSKKNKKDKKVSFEDEHSNSKKNVI